ncbi:MAG: Single-stranded nucleic acid binding R3H domain protein [Parcubacteria group bacterium GW2011_GWA2_43_9b]|uniref:R3H domain-containing protein n=1 Tax=Candidatus Portnoybacteria bacterium RIFCSPLOWO2_02_FULL_39_11 TaxID=1802001 RepID=A0A1G2FUJ7_9BACT|nr:MAG: Single-stranded nucleic acid binding R3H domain protein [Parcubacteria group bacterium GW2011_GWA2_43_9b]OGZ41278.1 MAG: hypothetical protein A3B04_03730 [Candidatus Portnoybacteria bacterium RIFCSPLOWO2_02_FULL_39_11]
MEQEKLSKIKEITEGLIEKMGLDGQATVVEGADLGAVVQIASQEAGYLIGRNGDNLKAIQQLVRALVSKQIVDAPRLTLDVNNYQQERLDMLKDTALGAARQVASYGTVRSLPPMNSYERRVVHTALAGIPGIKTESEGEGEERRIVIRPA